MELLLLFRPAEGRNGSAEDGRWENTWALEDTMEPQNCPNLEPRYLQPCYQAIRRAAKGMSQSRAAGVPVTQALRTTREADKAQAWANAESMQNYCGSI